ncbi:MAG: enoyl-CoA hydratase-related protein [Bacteriovoracaceae bacterium]
MDYKLIKYSRDERGVGTLTLNRPEIHNAFNDDLIAEVRDCFSQAEKDSDLRVMVITGEGRSFCAGADLNWMKAMKNYSFDENVADSGRMNEMFHAINTFSKPTIARVNGAALGGGAGLISCCDFVIAQEKAKIGFTEVKLGIIPAVISPYVVAKIGNSQARANFLCGRRFDAYKAKEMGLVHEVTGLDELDTKTEETIIDNNKLNLVFNVIDKARLGHQEVSRYTTEFIAHVRASDEGQEGMAALLEKRKPEWMGK